MADTSVPLVGSLNERNFAGGIELRVQNRFFEEDGADQASFSLVARAGTAVDRAIGPGPTIRATFTQDGVFNDDLFVVSGDGLFRYDGTTAPTFIGGAVGFTANFPTMAAQSSPGVERIWLADGTNLQYYEGVSRSQATLVLTAANVAANDTVNVGAVFYRFVASGVDAGTPAGTSANPWLVLTGGTGAGSLQNLGAAISANGTPGGQYSTALVAHPTAETRRVLDGSLIVQHRTPGVGGDATAVGETSAALQWRNTVAIPVTTLVDGGLHFLTRVPLPEGSDDATALEVTAIGSFVVVAANNQQRLYFIFPGEFWVDTFAAAEAEPDRLVSVKAVGDTLWVMGTSTIEIWNATGDEALPFAPVIGRSLRYGAVRDTVVVLDNDIFYVDTTGIARNGAGDRISTHTIEEKIRLRG